MAGNTAEIKWTTDDAAVMRSFEKMERNLDNMARKLDKVEKASKKNAEVTAGGFDKVAGAIGKTAMALIGGGSLLTAIDFVRDANRKLIEEAAELGKKYDELFRGLRVQAGLTELEGEKARAKVLDVATANAVKEDVAVAGARGLVGAGFTTADATGKALDVLLKGRAATNATGGSAEDLEGIATSIAAYLQSQGMQKNAANLQKVLQGGFALRQTGAFELENLTELGKHGAALRGLLSQEEQFAAFGTLVDQMPAAEAATSLRNIVSRLSTSRTGRTSAKALKEIGLTPADVDLVGENFSTALQRIDKGLQGIPEANRASVLKLLFEEAGVAPARALMRERTGRTAEYAQSIRGVGKEYAETIDVAQSGRAAAAARLGIQTNKAKAASDTGDDLIQAAIEADQLAHGVGPTGRAISRHAYDLYRTVGVPQNLAVTFTRPFGDRSAEQYYQDIYGRVNRAAGGETGIESLDAALKRNAEATERQTKEMQAQRTEPRVRDRVESEHGR